MCFVLFRISLRPCFWSLVVLVRLDKQLDVHEKLREDRHLYSYTSPAVWPHRHTMRFKRGKYRMLGVKHEKNILLEIGCVLRSFIVRGPNLSWKPLVCSTMSRTRKQATLWNNRLLIYYNNDLYFYLWLFSMCHLAGTFSDIVAVSPIVDVSDFFSDFWCVSL